MENALLNLMQEVAAGELNVCAKLYTIAQPPQSIDDWQADTKIPHTYVHVCTCMYSDLSPCSVFLPSLFCFLLHLSELPCLLSNIFRCSALFNCRLRNVSLWTTTKKTINVRLWIYLVIYSSPILLVHRKWGVFCTVNTHWVIELLTRLAYNRAMNRCTTYTLQIRTWTHKTWGKEKGESCSFVKWYV